VHFTKFCKLGPSYLVIVVVSVEERFFAEYHAGKHASQTPQIQRVVIQLAYTQKHMTVSCIRAKYSSHTAGVHLCTVQTQDLLYRHWQQKSTAKKTQLNKLTKKP